MNTKRYLIMFLGVAVCFLTFGGTVFAQEETQEVDSYFLRTGAFVGGEIDLEEAACALQKTVYDPEQFPGLIFRMDDPSITFLLFSKGKIVCAGARSEKSLYKGLLELEKLILDNKLISYDGNW